MDEFSARVVAEARSWIGTPYVHQAARKGAGTDCLGAPPVAWNGEDTYIQKTGIVQDFGVFDTPDAFYFSHEQSFGWLRGALYRHIIRHWMNARVRGLRSGRLKTDRRATHAHEEPANAT